MKKEINFGFILLWTISSFIQTSQQNDIRFPKSKAFWRSERETVVADAINHFGIEMYDFFASQHRDSSMVVSPMSMMVNLASIGKYTSNQTLEEISFVMRVSAKNPELTSDLLSIMDELHSNHKYQVKFVNRIYVQAGTKLRNNLTALDLAFIKRVDFTKTKKAVDFINSEIFEYSNGTIRDLIPTVSAVNIDKNSKLMLVNALYFKGHWKYPFSLARRKKVGQMKKDMYMMTSPKAYIGIGYDMNWGTRFIRIPYAGDQLSLLLIAPDDDVDISYVDEKLYTIRDWSYMLDRLYYMWTPLTIPKFKIESTMAVDELLKHFGVVTMFGNWTNLDSLFPGSSQIGVHVNTALHKTHVDISENLNNPEFVNVPREPTGSKGLNISQYPVVVIPPFLFVIYHEQWGALLYGRQTGDFVTEPQLPKVFDGPMLRINDSMTTTTLKHANAVDLN